VQTESSEGILVWEIRRHPLAKNGLKMYLVDVAVFFVCVCVFNGSLPVRSEYSQPDGETVLQS